MGLTYVEGRVKGVEGQEEETLRFLVDSGAYYSLLPLQTWQSLGLEPYREERFVLADGTAVTRNVSYCYMRLPQADGYTPVVLGEPGDDQALLGALTLETMGLLLNPFSRTLHPLQLPWRS